MRFVEAAGAAAVIVAACGGDTGGGSPSSSAIPPSACVSPCAPGAQCLQAVEDNCTGAWYCWGDARWHCAPPDASAPGDGGFDAAEVEASLSGEGAGDGGAPD